MNSLISSTMQIELTRGQVSIIDGEDYDFLCKYTWHVQKRYGSDKYREGRNYAVTGKITNNKKVQIRMHRMIMEKHGWNIEGLEIDHINHDGLDNRKTNLRIVTGQQNCHNRRPRANSIASQHKGVCLEGRFWKAQIMKDGQKIHIGVFNSEKEAAKAYDAYAFEYFCEYAYLNFPKEPLWTMAEADACKRTKKAVSGYRGVYLTTWDIPDGTWTARIYHDGTTLRLGAFDTPEEAALAYNEAAVRLKGDKAKLNVITTP